MASCDEIRQKIQDMQDDTINSAVFWAAYKIGKEQSFIHIPTEVSMQELNEVNRSHVLHSDKTCADIINPAATEMKRKMVDDIIANRLELWVLIDKSTTISDKPVLVVCLQAAIADTEQDLVYSFWMRPQEMMWQRHCWHVFTNMAVMTTFWVSVLWPLHVIECQYCSTLGIATQLCVRFPDLFV